MSRILREIEATGTDTIYFIKRADGESWAVHVRNKGDAPSLYALAEGPTLTDAVERALEKMEPSVEDLL